MDAILGGNHIESNYIMSKISPIWWATSILQVSRRVVKRIRGGERGTFGDGQRRRSPRLSSSTATSSPCPHIIDHNCSRQSDNNYGAISTDARGTTSKHDQLSVLCDSYNNEEDNEKLVLDRNSCATPYSTKHEYKQLHRCEQGDGAPIHRAHLNADESWLPEKSTLELVLDTLQRRDTYDIFAEPVDPSEVEEYYEIIKEPMDFGTMRAKLHEAVYKNLQEFERDMFLIFENAMHFNSSATVYFRQARALEELAKKVFHVLKTDPEKFKLEFTATRRRSSRRFNVELSDITIGSCRKLARDLGSNSTCINLGQKGCQRQRKTFVTGFDRRSTYRPWTCLPDEASSTFSPTNYGMKSLIFGNQEDVGYKESLMLYVKDLGPTAYMVANSKLQGSWTQASSNHGMSCWDSSQSECQPHAASFPFQRESNRSFNGSGTVPVTNPASLHLFDIDIRKQSRVNYCENTLPSPAKELEHTQVVDFDLNQVQATPSSSSSCSHAVVSCSKDGELRTPSRLLGARELNHLSPAITTVSSVSVSTQSTFHLLYLNSRLRESLKDGLSTDGQSAALQLPCDTKLGFWNVASGCTNQKGGYGGHHHHIGSTNTKLPNLTLEL